MARRYINLGRPQTTLGFSPQPQMPAEAQPQERAEQPRDDLRARAIMAALSEQRDPIDANGDLAHALIQGGARAFDVRNDVRASRGAMEEERSRYADELAREKAATAADAEDRQLRREALQSQIEQRNRPETRVTSSGTFWREGEEGAPQIMGRDPNWQPPAATVYQPPAGYRGSPEEGLEAIPGGPADVRANAEGRARGAQMDASIRSLGGAVAALDRAIPQVNGWSSGAIGQMTRGIGGTPALNLDQALEPVRAILSFETLAEMRRNSTTGGALGSIAVRELELLGNTVDSLNTAQGTPQLRQALGNVRAQLARTLAAVQAARSELGDIEEAAPAPVAGNGIENMTDEQLMQLREQMRGR